MASSQNFDKSFVSVVEDKPQKRRARGIPQPKYGKAPPSYKSRLPQKEPPKKPPKEESILEWFDRSVENELKKRQDDPLSTRLELNIASGTSHPHVVQSATSGIDIQASLSTAPPTELSQAVDKLAKAQAIAAFQGAVKAAEMAAASASPENAEEAAVAGARGYEAALTSMIKQKVDGARPIEVVGYVGITWPKEIQH